MRLLADLRIALRTLLLLLGLALGLVLAMGAVMGTVVGLPDSTLVVYLQVAGILSAALLIHPGSAAARPGARAIVRPAPRLTGIGTLRRREP